MSIYVSKQSNHTNEMLLHVVPVYTGQTSIEFHANNSLAEKYTYEYYYNYQMP